MPPASRSDPSRLGRSTDPSGGKEPQSRQTHREMSSKASFWQQREINYRLTCTFLTAKLVAMKTGELRRWTVFASFPSVVIFSPSLSQQDMSALRKKEKKKKRGEASCSRIVVKGIIIESWQQASRQMVFEKKPAAGRGAHTWMNAALSSCENLFYPTMRCTGNIRKDKICMHSSEPELTDQSEQRLTHKECETCLMIQNAGTRTKCFLGNISAIRVYVIFPVILHLCKVILAVIKPFLSI